MMHSSTNHPPHVKGNWSRRILIGLIVLSALSFLVPHRPSKGRLFAKLTECLREERFEQLYEEANDSLPLNVSKKGFVRRMKATAAKLKAIDPKLNFKPNARMDDLLRGNNGRDAVLITVAKTLEGNGKSVSVLISWNLKGEFFDLSVTPENGTPEEFNVYGVSYKSRSVGGQVIEE